MYAADAPRIMNTDRKQDRELDIESGRLNSLCGKSPADSIICAFTILMETGKLSQF